jgi:transposase
MPAPLVHVVIGRWVRETGCRLTGRLCRRATAERTKGKSGGLTAAEREELARLRKENRELRLERDTLKKATAFFAKESR